MAADVMYWFFTIPERQRNSYCTYQFFNFDLYCVNKLHVNAGCIIGNVLAKSFYM